jgi:hypothetical protein
MPPAGGAVKLYHTTDAGKAILEKGFRDHSGSYLLENFTLTGVFVSDLILDINEGATGDDVSDRRYLSEGSMAQLKPTSNNETVAAISAGD